MQEGIFNLSIFNFLGFLLNDIDLNKNKVYKIYKIW